MGYIDMGNKVLCKIQVTQSDIDECLPSSSYLCAICNALRKIYKDSNQWVYVNIKSIFVNRVIYDCSNELKLWQNNLIAEKQKVLPFELILDDNTHKAYIK